MVIQSTESPIPLLVSDITSNARIHRPRPGRIGIVSPGRGAALATRLPPAILLCPSGAIPFLELAYSTKHREEL